MFPTLFTKLLDIESADEKALHQLYLPLKNGGCGIPSHSAADLGKFYISSALLIAPIVYAATGFWLGSAAPRTVLDANSHYFDSTAPSELSIANAVRLLVEAGISPPNFAHVGQAEAASFAAQAALRIKTIQRDVLEQRFLDTEDHAGRARVLSAGGVGAQWLACLPTLPPLSFTDEEFRLALRFRLGLDTFTAGVCPHVNSYGQVCGAVCDSQGWHLLACPSGGGYFVGHDSIVAAYGALIAGPDGIPGAKAAWKPEVNAWNDHPEPDACFSNLPGSRDVYVDGVLSLANPATYVGCENRAGHLAELKKRAKHRDRPVFDARHRRMHPFNFVALSFERHGFWARETVSFTKRLAMCRATMLGLEPSDEIQRWYAVIACTLQRSNAKILKGEAIPACPSLSRQRWGFAANHDLPLAGR